MTTSSSSLVTETAIELNPLTGFYRRAGRPLPKVHFCPGSTLPEPARTLLHHERDMTRTLERYHGGAIHLHLISYWRDGDAYCRESVLELDGTDQPIEFGAIEISLLPFPEIAQRQILEGRQPLGGILNSSGMEYSSRPSAFFRLEPDAFITCALHLQEQGLLYGRQNTLRNAEGVVLARIVEILPPTRKLS